MDFGRRCCLLVILHFLVLRSEVFLQVHEFSNIASEDSSMSVGSDTYSELEAHKNIEQDTSSTLRRHILMEYFILRAFDSVSSTLPFYPVAVPRCAFSPTPVGEMPHS